MVLVGLIALLLAACDGDADPPDTTNPDDTGPPFTLTFDFENGSNGWAREVSDFSQATHPGHVLTETGVAPPGFEEGGGFIHLAASNRSDDLFLYMMRLIGPEVDLEPNTSFIPAAAGRPDK